MAKLNTNAALTWTDPGTGTERVFLLAVPLRDLRPGFSQSAYFAQSLDRTATASVTVGSGAHELVGMVRYADDPQALLDLVQAGATQTTLTYIPNLADPGQSYTVKLVSPVDVTSVQVDLDRQRGVQFGEAEMELRFRKTDQSAFTELYDGTPVLFAYRAGDSLSGYTFTRADTATYASKGYATNTSAATGKARIEWADTNADGIRETPTLLLEATSTNLVTSSSNFGAWTAVSAPTLTSGQSDPAGGTSAYLIADTDAVNQSYVHITPTFTTNATKAISIWLKMGTSLAAGGCAIQLRDTTAGADRLLQVITWTDGVPSVTQTTGTLVATERYRDDWYRFLFTTTSVTVANTNNLRVIPANTANQTGNVYAFGAQAENMVQPTSYIPTSGGTDARTTDALTKTIAFKPQALTVYCRFIERGNAQRLGTTGNMVVLGGTTAAIRWLIGSSTGYQFRHLSFGTTVTSELATAPTYGQTVELRGTVSATGVVQANQSINGAAETSGTASAARPFAAAFDALTVGINNTAAGATQGIGGYTHVYIFRGNLTLETCRRLAGVT